jgi:hypothetical protein
MKPLAWHVGLAAACLLSSYAGAATRGGKRADSPAGRVDQKLERYGQELLPELRETGGAIVLREVHSSPWSTGTLIWHRTLSINGHGGLMVHEYSNDLNYERFAESRSSRRVRFGDFFTRGTGFRWKTRRREYSEEWGLTDAEVDDKIARWRADPTRPHQRNAVEQHPRPTQEQIWEGRARLEDAQAHVREWAEAEEARKRRAAPPPRAPTRKQHPVARAVLTTAAGVLAAKAVGHVAHHVVDAIRDSQ